MKIIKRKNGVSKIIRSGYSTIIETWYSIRAKALKRDNHTCVSCGCKQDPKTKTYLDVHHIRALSRGGTTVLSNLISLCKICHSKRHKHL